MQNRIRAVLMAAAIGLAGAAGHFLGARQSAQAAPPQSQPPQDNPELQRMYEEDQAARSVADPAQIDWAVVSAQDSERRKRVKDLFAQDLIVTGNDYYHAAMVLQHGDVPEDHLLAHELAVAAIVKGKNDARWLAAAAEDRFLMNIGRPQRFATQFRAEKGGAWQLYETDPSVTDSLRKLMGARTLQEAREQEARMNQGR